jgi:hypothetical protein
MRGNEISEAWPIAVVEANINILKTRKVNIAGRTPKRDLSRGIGSGT